MQAMEPEGFTDSSLADAVLVGRALRKKATDEKSYAQVASLVSFLTLQCNWLMFLVWQVWHNEVASNQVHAKTVEFALGSGLCCVLQSGFCFGFGFRFSPVTFSC